MASAVVSEPTQTQNPTATAVTAPAKELSLADILDKELGTSTTPEAAIAEKPIEAPVQEAKEAVKQQAEPIKEQAKTPTSILDKVASSLAETKTPENSVKEEAPKAEIKDEVEETLPDSTPAAQTAFAKLTRELKEAKNRLKEMEGKVAARTEAVENKGGNVETDTQLKTLQEKLQQLSAERDEMESELRVSKIEATKEFKSVISEPTKAVVQSISDIAKAYELRPNSIVDVSQEADGAKRRAMLKELTSEMDPVDALQVRTKVEELVQLNTKRESMIKESRAMLETLSKAEEEKEAVERARYDQEAKKAFGEVWENFQKNVPILQKIEGNEDWNKTVDTIRLQAEKLDSEPLDHRQRAALTYQAVALPVLVQVFKDYVAKSTQETTSLKQSLEEYRKATPGAGSGKALDKPDALDKSLSFLDAVTR